MLLLQIFSLRVNGIVRYIALHLHERDPEEHADEYGELALSHRPTNTDQLLGAT